MYVHNLSAVGEQYLDFEPPDDRGRTSRPAARSPGREVDARRRGRPAGRARPVRRARSTRATSRPSWRSSARCSTTPARRCSGCSTTAASSSVRRPPTPTRPSRCSTRQEGAHHAAGREDNIRSLSRDLHSLTDALAAATASSRRSSTARPAPPASRRLLKDLEPTLPVLLGSAVGVNQVVVSHLDGVEQLLVTYPRTISRASPAPRRRLRTRQPAVRNSVPPCTRATSREPVAAAERPDRREDLPGACNSGPPNAMRGSNYSPGTPGNPSPRRLYRSSYDPRPGSSAAPWTDGAILYGSSIRGTCRSWEMTLGNGSWWVRSGGE